jgi:hypothetical protein
MGVPLVSTSTRRRQYVLIPFCSGSSHLISGFDLVQGQDRRELPSLALSATAGLEFIVRSRSHDVLRGIIAQRLVLGASDGFYKFVRGNVIIGPPQLRIHTALLVDPSTGRLLLLSAGIGTRLKSTSMESGVFHYAANIPQPFLLPLIDLPDEASPRMAFEEFGPALTVARQRATLELGPYVSANAVAYETAWPKPRLDLLGYGIMVGPRCGCFQFRIDAWHRLGSAVPEIAASIIVPTL